LHKIPKEVMTTSVLPGDIVKILSYGEDAEPAKVLTTEHNGLVKVQLADGDEIEVSPGDLKLLNR